MFKRFVLSAFLAMFFFFPHSVFARQNVNDWYFKDFDSQIIVNNDSSLDITETIVADCGNAPDKHGIYRILPTQIDTEGKKIKTPVKLISINNENGMPYEFETINSLMDGTLTWKIGSASRTVRGVNTYVIHYVVQNAIRFSNPDFDELYWNLNGNFWDLEIDKFHASIIFPQEIKTQNSKVEYYTGDFGSKDKGLATYKWSSPNVLEFVSTKTLLKRQGITASITFPKNIITPYQPSFLEKYGEYLYFLIPLAVLAILFLLWRKYGDDPDFNKTIIAEYEIPAGLSPIETGMIMKSGGFNNTFITAEIISLATKGLITIKEIESKVLFFTNKDHELTKNYNPEADKTLNEAQHEIVEGIFKDGQTVKLSSLKNSFYKNIPAIKKATTKILKDKGYLETTGFYMGNILKGLGALLVILSVPLGSSSFFLTISLFVTAVIMIVFSFIMPKRTLAGTEMNWKINGFKLFMETVDKDRAEFYEKENIFEKCLPYAILFGMTKIWINKIKEIYGQEYFASHVPIWYVGSTNSFDVDSFGNFIENLSSDISAATGSPSGAGGAGMSGGGGGGGGGGGW